MYFCRYVPFDLQLWPVLVRLNCFWHHKLNIAMVTFEKVVMFIDCSLRLLERERERERERESLSILHVELAICTSKYDIFCRMKRILGAQWLSGRVLDSRPRGREF